MREWQKELSRNLLARLTGPIISGLSSSRYGKLFSRSSNGSRLQKREPPYVWAFACCYSGTYAKELMKEGCKSAQIFILARHSRCRLSIKVHSTVYAGGGAYRGVRLAIGAATGAARQINRNRRMLVHEIIKMQIFAKVADVVDRQG